MRWALIASMLAGCSIGTRPGLCGDQLKWWERARSTEVDTGFAADDCPVNIWDQGEVNLRDDRCADGDDCFREPTVRITGDEVVFEYIDGDDVRHQARYLRTD